MTTTLQRHGRVDRRIPGSLAALVARLARDRPPVVTYRDLQTLIDENGWLLDAERAARQLQRLGWLVPLSLRGTWAFLPAGENEVFDPYVDLRAWETKEPDAVFALAGEAAAWHLGLLDRAFDGPVALWVPAGRRVPYGLRPHVSVVTLGWGPDEARRLSPTPAYLRRRGLDLTGWAGGLRAFGPEALVVQLAARPASFRPWADLVAHLDQLVGDVDTDRLGVLLAEQSSSAWQRASYLLARGARTADAEALLERRPATVMPKVQFGADQPGVWVPEFQLTDRLIVPLQRAGGKA